MKQENKVARALLTLAWPAILEGLFQTLLQYVDTAMVGRLGPAATATVSLSSTYSWLINSVISGLGIGFLSYIARGIGESDHRKVQEAARWTTIVAVAVGFVVMGITLWMAPHMPVWMGAEPSLHQDATRYFIYVNLPMVFRAATIIFGAAIRATGDTKTPMFVNVFVSFLNIGLNYLFIYVLSYGAVGAGMATAVSVTIGGVMMTVVFLRKPVLWDRENRELRFHYCLNKAVFMAIMTIGLPIVLTRVASCLGHVVFTSFVSSMSTTIYAAHAIAITAEEIFYIPGYGMMAATSTMIGNAIGEGNHRKERDVKLASVGIIFLLMCISGLLLFIGAEFMMGIFTQDEQVIAIGAKLLRMVAFTEPIFGTSAVMEGIYNGMGKTRYPLVVELVSMWGVRIVGSYICIQFLGLGITAVWVMMIANNIIKAIMLATGLKKVNKEQNQPI